MPDYQYLILGGGMTGDAAVKGIRAVDPEGSIGVISAEPDPPYDRPPLSKGLWQGTDESDIWRGTEDRQAELHLSTLIVHLDPEAHELTDDQGEVYRYEKLLFATGGTPVELPFGGGDVIYFRTFQDYQRLREMVENRERFAVVGGGFIGSELAAALAQHDRKVTMVFPEPGIGAGRFPDDLADFLKSYYQSRGVNLITGDTVVGLNPGEEGTEVVTDGGKRVTVDAVVAGLGIRSNSAVAEAAGVDVEDGIRVNSSLQSSHPDIYAAGDVASFHNSDLGMWLRVEHEDNANTMGEMAGRSMAGEDVTYDYLPFFYSDLFDLGYEAVGLQDRRMKTFEDWEDMGNKGVVYYLDDGRVRGVLLWNVWGKVDEARALIAEPGPFEAQDLSGRIAG